MLRLFLAINLPDDIKNLLQEKVEKIKRNYKKMSIRFTPPEQWHLTLIFLGYQPAETVSLIQQALTSSSFKKDGKINFDKIVYGPLSSLSGEPGNKVRMIWLTTTKETSLFLNDFKEKIEEKMISLGVKWFQEKRTFQGHLTLARFKTTPLKNLPPLKEDFSYSFEIKKIDLMKSTLRREGAFYEKLFTVAY